MCAPWNDTVPETHSITQHKKSLDKVVAPMRTDRASIPATLSTRDRRCKPLMRSQSAARSPPHGSQRSSATEALALHTSMPTPLRAISSSRAGKGPGTSPCSKRTNSRSCAACKATVWRRALGSSSFALDRTKLFPNKLPEMIESFKNGSSTLTLSSNFPCVTEPTATSTNRSVTRVSPGRSPTAAFLTSVLSIVGKMRPWKKAAR
mmetsp:Transcript_13498/g.37058  ORF Transcript_13498/g.37058 Transcript_13498/m.37058 type:complete len:206 (-) Transcript_13498:592-1209(-)